MRRRASVRILAGMSQDDADRSGVKDRPRWISALASRQDQSHFRARRGRRPHHIRRQLESDETAGTGRDEKSAAGKRRRPNCRRAATRLHRRRHCAEPTTGSRSPGIWLRHVHKSALGRARGRRPLDELKDRGHLTVNEPAISRRQRAHACKRHVKAARQACLRQREEPRLHLVDRAHRAVTCPPGT